MNRKPLDPRRQQADSQECLEFVRRPRKGPPIDPPQQPPSPRTSLEQRIEHDNTFSRDTVHFSHEAAELFVGQMVRHRNTYGNIHVLVAHRERRGIRDHSSSRWVALFQPIELRRIDVDTHVLGSGFEQRDEVARPTADVQDRAPRCIAQRTPDPPSRAAVTEKTLQNVIRTRTLAKPTSVSTPRFNGALGQPRNPSRDGVNP